jgi:CBS domain containing-hemolysin-like protein/mannitol/fructose-specific phosphotransferase system IIA component (Ntr-type)
VIAFHLILAVGLLLVNAFFVLAEFAAVKVRSSKIQELVDRGNARARLMQHITENLDEYLSVCQVGITCASIALGFVGEPLAQEVILPMVSPFFPAPTAHDLAVTLATIVGVLIVSGVHILFGEQIPKLVSIRRAEQVASFTAWPLQVSRWLLFIPLSILNGASQLVLGLLGLGRPEPERHSEDELRIILDQSQSGGVLSFRRLLFMENIFELGELTIVDAMRRRASVQSLVLGLPWTENRAVIAGRRFSRFPVLESAGAARPVGVVHVKDLFLAEGEPDLARLARPYLTAQENSGLEPLLADMQRRRIHVAIVVNAAGDWTGFITMEDIIEEIIGTVEDEFEPSTPLSLGETLSEGRVVLGVEGVSLASAIRAALARVPMAELGIDNETIIKAVLEREKVAGTYLGKGVALPHARIPNLPKPVLIFIRSDAGIPVEGIQERAQILFVLLTPAGQPRVHQRLQARIAGILENSDYVDERLRNAATPAEVLEVIRTGEQASLD